jgi:putative transposase
VRTAFKCRAYPDEEQAVVLGRTFGCVRKVWNEVLAWRTERFRNEGLRIGFAESSRYLTEMKKAEELAFLNDVSAVPLQQAVRHQSAAFANFFAGRARFPRFKFRSGRQSATYTGSAFRFREGELFLAKMPRALRIIWSFEGVDLGAVAPTSVTVSREPDGSWYVSLAVVGDPPTALEPTGTAIGVDLGITHFAVTSEGDRIANRRHFDAERKRLTKYQRRMARTKPGSANRVKAARKVAKVHGEVRRARADRLHKTTTDLVRSYDVIVIEDLNVSGMLRNRALARSIADCGWGIFRDQLEYKAAKWGRRLVVVDRYFPSSKRCSHCGQVLATLSLDTRHWTCDTCGTRHDRDVNAAKNILAEGLSATACGAGVRLQGTSLQRSAMRQETPPVRVGTLS